LVQVIGSRRDAAHTRRQRRRRVGRRISVMRPDRFLVGETRTGLPDGHTVRPPPANRPSPGAVWPRNIKPDPIGTRSGLPVADRCPGWLRGESAVHRSVIPRQCRPSTREHGTETFHKWVANRLPSRGLALLVDPAPMASANGSDQGQRPWLRIEGLFAAVQPIRKPVALRAPQEGRFTASAAPLTEVLPASVHVQSAGRAERPFRRERGEPHHITALPLPDSMRPHRSFVDETRSERHCG
jgi:hypothetical protein